MILWYKHDNALKEKITWGLILHSQAFASVFKQIFKIMFSSNLLCLYFTSYVPLIFDKPKKG